MSTYNFDTYETAELDSTTPGWKILIAFGCDGVRHAINVSEEAFEGKEVVYAILRHTSIVGLCDDSCIDKKDRGGFICEAA